MAGRVYEDFRIEISRPTAQEIEVRVVSAAGGEAVADTNSVLVRVGSTVGEAERMLILRTLEHTGQNKTRAAETLGISLKTLHNKLKEYEAQRESGGF